MSNIDPKGFLLTLIALLRNENQDNIADFLIACDLEFEQTRDFTKKTGQRKEYIIIRHPLRLTADLEPYKDFLHRMAVRIYDETDDYDLYGVKFRIKAIPSLQSDEDEPKDVQHYAKGQVYENLLDKIHKLTSINPIEKMYVIEACECAKRDLRLAAATMLGCAAEHVLIRFTEAFYVYMGNHQASATELSTFKSKVLGASKISNRLTEFLKYIPQHKNALVSLGLENPERKIDMYFDPIRLIRNDSGHPTGKVISQEDLNTEFSHFQLIMNYVYPCIEGLRDPFLD
ncbi:hypothetical protein [Paenibacillus sp. Soil787]|uniref:hypothetical protein n=1 Tax=Paenibacillus sp. Soil787 TaxID=1736411 RepID=UPI0006F6F21D|nr:hypothetical protein [Paenibacillus sp. Soil787]KRF31669.1 hypothetical protein ASG93_04845 [Paenibacillus sp. Soil787]